MYSSTVKISQAKTPCQRKTNHVRIKWYSSSELLLKFKSFEAR